MQAVIPYDIKEENRGDEHEPLPGLKLLFLRFMPSPFRQ